MMAAFVEVVVTLGVAVDDWEEAYNAEVERLINEGLKCPECKGTPQKVEPIIYSQLAQVTCVNGHMFIIDKENGH